MKKLQRWLKNLEPMKVIIDTNILISALYHNSQVCNKDIEYATIYDKLYIPEFVISELIKITFLKYQQYIPILLKFLDKLTKDFNILITDNRSAINFPAINNHGDNIIYQQFINYEFDLLITGDNYFLSLKDNRFIAPKQYLFYYE